VEDLEVEVDVDVAEDVAVVAVGKTFGSGKIVVGCLFDGDDIHLHKEILQKLDLGLGY